MTTPALPAPWRLPFDLAWEAFRAGSRPIGAVLLDGDGEVVATGRNRSQESTAPPGQLVGTAIAHAEINALAQLPAGRRYENHRLYTTLEPCLLCSSALIHTHVRHVLYAAPDAYWTGIEDVPRVGGQIGARWARREGPADAPLAAFSVLLMNIWAALHSPPELGNQGGDGSAALARRCLTVDGLLDAPTAEAAYRLVFPYLPQRPEHRLPGRPGPDHPGR
ncbi:nucleoside deaminase [Streptomyces sp. NBC_00203]|uniref:nucleoside deaminase n=1 Tax=Streptomyces sp. NBC_00203 TaxID=2975680 RepID=UPI00324F5280